MSKLITPLIGLALAVWIIGWAWWFSKNYCGTTVTTPETPALNISDGTFNTKSFETFSFGLGSHSPNVPEKTNFSFEQLGEYLSENPERYLNLTGIYGSYEENPTVYENLGIGRAESIKEILVSHGASAANILTTGTRIDNSVFENDKMNGGVYFTFMEEPVELKSEEVITEVINETPFEGYTVYYNTGEYELDINDEDMFDYLKSLKRYLRSNPDRKTIIYGHTDNIGDRRTNDRLSQARARKIRRYLVDSGVKRNQIEFEFFAYDSPKDTNETKEGRRNNRRVEITVR